MLDLESIEKDRAERRAYWRARGIYTDLTYADAFREGAQAYPETRVIFHSHIRPAAATVAETYETTERLASALHHLGLRPGDRMAVFLPTWCDATLAYIAGLKLGLVVVPIVAIYGARELGFILRQTKARALLLPDQWRGHDYLERLQGAGVLPALEHVMVIGERRPAGALDWDELLKHEEVDYPRGAAGADDVCCILYTSGTTADPKGVKHTHNTQLCDLNAARKDGPDAAAAMNRDAGRAGPALCVYPAGHVASYLAMLRPFVFGKSMVYMDQWLPGEAAELIARHQIGASTGPPIFLSTLMKAAAETGADISSLKQFDLGAAGVSPENVRWTDALGLPSGRVYGMTEHPVVSMPIVGDPFERRAYTDGKITARNQVRIVDDDGADVPLGEVGEIATLGPRLFVGYVDEALDRACFLPGGWYRTGDIGRLDADGYLTITDRKKDIIIRGGENISSREVEHVLAGHPAVHEAAVAAMPDPVLGERVCAFVVLEAGAALTLADVRAHFEAQGVAIQKTPERIVVVEELPRTHSGKVKKDVLREQLSHAPSP